MHPRFQDWPTRLAEFIETRRFTPFKWGKNDCCLFAADAVLAMTGVDPAKRLRGYRTALGAARKAKRHRTKADPYGVAQWPTLCGFEPVPVAFAQRGDMVQMTMPAGPAICICLGEMSAGAGKECLTFLPTLAATHAWKVRV